MIPIRNVVPIVQVTNVDRCLSLLETLAEEPDGLSLGSLAERLDLPKSATHRLLQTLGAFRVWRGDVEVEPREWQRGTARQLFQLLLTERGRWLQREEIIEKLWPQLGAGAAQRDFKVALNALKEAVEPARGADGVSAYVEREGSAYRLRMEADLWVDCEEFERGCQAGLGLNDVSQQVRVLGVNFDALQGDELRTAAGQLGIRFTVLASDPAPRLGLAPSQVLPVTWLIDPQGRVREQLSGEQTAMGLKARLVELRRPAD